jgi:hypothetical protein
MWRHVKTIQPNKYGIQTNRVRQSNTKPAVPKPTTRCSMYRTASLRHAQENNKQQHPQRKLKERKAQAPDTSSKSGSPTLGVWNGQRLLDTKNRVRKRTQLQPTRASDALSCRQSLSCRRPTPKLNDRRWRAASRGGLGKPTMAVVR